MKKKLLVIFGIILILIFAIYNISIDVGSIHLGKQTDEIQKNNEYDIRSSQFYKQFLSSDKLIIINLWATWCKPCIEELPIFLKLQKDYPEIQFATISIDKDKEKLEKFLLLHKEIPDITFQNAEYRKAIRNFLESRVPNSLIRTDIVPVTYFIKNGKVLKRIEGSIDYEEVKTALNLLK